MTTYYYYKNKFEETSWASVTPANMDGYYAANIAVESTSGSTPDIDAGKSGITKITIKGDIAIPVEVFKNCTNLKTLTISDGVTSIGANAFYNCTNLTLLTITEGVISIGNGAFQQAGISTLTIPASVKTIGSDAFSNCPKLQTLTISDNDKTIGENAFVSCTSLNNVIFTTAVNSTKIHFRAFASCTSLALTIQNGIIYDQQFNFYYDLKGLTLGNDVVFSGDNNFIGCTLLKKLTLGSNLTSIPANAFQKCHQLEEVIIPNLVTDIGNDAFADCIGLINLTIGAKVKFIGINAFGDCNNLNNLRIGDEVTEIRGGAFQNCSELIEIRGGAFQNCSELAEVIIPESVTYIGDNAFKNCKSGLTIIVDNDDIVFKNRPDGKNSSSAFETANTTLYINKDMLAEKLHVFGSATACITRFKIPSLSFEYVLIKQGIKGDSIKMPTKNKTIKHHYEMKQTSANKFSNIFSDITIVKTPTANDIIIYLDSDLQTTLNIPINNNLVVEKSTNSSIVIDAQNSTLLEKIIDKVGDNINKSAYYTLSGLLIKESDTRNFADSFKRISVEIGAHNPNKDTDTYKLINESNVTFNTYKDYINITATVDNFRAEFIKYFQSNRDKFLTIFDLLKYSSMDVDTYKNYEFNIYAGTGFEFETNAGTTTFQRLIKIN